MSEPLDVRGISARGLHAIGHAQATGSTGQLMEWWFTDYAALALQAAVRTSDEDVVILLRAGVEIDGAAHKQYYLEQLAESLGVQLPDHIPGVAP